MEKKVLTGYPSIDKPWLKYYSEETLAMKIPNESPYELFRRTCVRKRKSIAFTYILAENREVNLTFEKVLYQIDRCASSIAVQNQLDKIIMAILPNTPESKELMFACFKTGNPFYPINPMTSPKDFQNIIENPAIDVGTVFIFDGFFDKYGEALLKSNKIKNIVMMNAAESLPAALRMLAFMKKPRKLPNHPKILTFEQFLGIGRENKNATLYHYNQERTALIIGTSGTTGTPKSVCLTGRNINTPVIEHINPDTKILEDEHYFDVMMISIAYGAITTIYTMVGGLRSYYQPGLTIDCFPFIKKYSIDHVAGGPIHVEEYKKHVLCGERVYNVKNWVSGGAILSRDTERLVNQVPRDYSEAGAINDKILIRQGYGATENGGVVSYQFAGSYQSGSVGIPLTKVNVGIFEPGTDTELPYNTVGEICVSGPSVMKGYLNNPEETNKVLIRHHDGEIWFHTKDLGQINQDGQIFIVDRIKNIFGRRGFNVHPTVVSEAIRELPFVANAYVVGVPHPDEQCVPVAFVVLNKSVSAPSAEEKIIEHCKNVLEEPSIPYEIVFVDEIPINAGGKPDGELLVTENHITYIS